ncbi:MAG: hypothetical protein AAFR55_05180 [Pseudomonadota bacterium]
MSDTPINGMKARAVQPVSLGDADGPAQVPNERLTDIAVATADLAAVARTISDALPLTADIGDIFAVMAADADARDAAGSAKPTS